MNQINEYNDLNFGLQESLGEKLQNTILRIQAKKQLNNDSSNSSDEEINIQYYEQFLKSLKDENKNQSPKHNKKKKNDKNKIKSKHSNSKDHKKSNNNNNYFENENNIHNFFKMRPKSMAKNYMKNKISIEEFPKRKSLGDSIFNFKTRKNSHYRFILNSLSKNKINEVDESLISNQINNENDNDNDNIIIYSNGRRRKQSCFLGSHPYLISQKNNLIENQNNNNNININNININNSNNDNIIEENKKIVKINNKNENKENRKSNNTSNLYIKDSEENINTKNENITSNINKNNTNKFDYILPIKKKKKLFCCCIPIG